MTKSFANYNYDDALKWFGVKMAPDSTVSRFFEDPRRGLEAEAAAKYYDGDHWQNSLGFMGELPPLGISGAVATRRKIRDGFVSENVIREVVKTHVGGILGREPVWSFLPADARQVVGTERNTTTTRDDVTAETLTPWWNERQALLDLQKAARILVLEGRSVRHLFIPRGLLNNGRVTATDLTAALRFIYFETVTADMAGVFTDPETQAQIGIFLYDELDANGDVLNKAAELSFLDGENTRIRIVRDKGKDETLNTAYQLGGRLLVYEFTREALITTQVQSMQRALNLAHTMMMRNVNMAGSRERIVTNAKRPVEQRTITGPDGTQSQVQTDGKFHVGAGATNFLVGYPIYDDAGTKIIGYTNPNVNITDPASVETFVATADQYRSGIYSQCHQRHVLIVDKADTSGRAREVARREFERSLKETKAIVDAGGRWQLETTLRLAAQLANQSTRYLRLRADFNCLIDAGEPDSEKQKTVLELRKPGGPKNQPLISDETSRNWIGVEDAAAELQKITQEATVDAAELPATKSPQDVAITPQVTDGTSTVQ